jgi:hypothetical protein
MSAPTTVPTTSLVHDGGSPGACRCAVPAGFLPGVDTCRCHYGELIRLLTSVGYERMAGEMDTVADQLGPRGRELLRLCERDMAEAIVERKKVGVSMARLAKEWFGISAQRLHAIRSHGKVVQP